LNADTLEVKSSLRPWENISSSQLSSLAHELSRQSRSSPISLSFDHTRCRERIWEPLEEKTLEGHCSQDGVTALLEDAKHMFRLPFLIETYIH
jgi:hypothetical protein